MSIKPCPYCGKDDWTRIMDSLAASCECGFVLVECGSGSGPDAWEPGASLQQWANDVYQAGLTNPHAHVGPK